LKDLGGIEQLFDVRDDYYDCHDLSAKPEHTERLANYRRKLIEELEAVGDSNAVNSKLRATDPRLADPAAPRRYKNNGVRSYYWPSSPDMKAAPPESYRGLSAEAD